MRLLIEVYSEEIPAAYMPSILRQAKKFFRNALKAKVDILGTCRRLVILAEGIDENIDASTAVNEFVSRISLPKKMRWDDSGIRYARPIRNILALSDNGLVKFSLGNLVSNNQTLFLDGRNFLLTTKGLESIDDYFSFMRSIGVILSPEERKERLKTALLAVGKENGCVPNIEESLLEEINYLIESPYVFVGRFDKLFLELPREVLISSMAKNQKLFTMSDKDGNMVNLFAGVLEAQSRQGFDYSDIVDRVESVLSAKLSDAYFFWKEDIKIPLKERAKALDKVLLHAGIGSMRDKIDKMKTLIKDSADVLGIDAKEKEELLTAAELSKADLESLMVYEFPELQGIMGYYYAIAQGIDKPIAEAIKGHYHPVNFEDSLPESRLGRFLSIIERVSDITAYFKAGLKPTGNEDPFGVRRMVLTLIKLIVNSPESINLKKLFGISVSIWDAPPEVLPDIEAYFKDRVLALFVQRGIRRDIASAVWNTWGMNIRKGLEVARELNRLSKTDDFKQALKVIERTHKITKKVDKSALPDVDTKLFEEKEESELWKEFSSIEKEFNKDSVDINAIVSAYAKLSPYIHEFFDKVMVNVNDQAIRNNRLSIMLRINRLFSKKAADFYG